MKKSVVLIFLFNYSYSNGLNYINSIRVSSGASSLKYSKVLSFAAKKHTIYLNRNQEFGHSENRFKRYYFGYMPWDRIAKAGFGSKAVVENISFGESSYKKSIDKIMATVYHRLAFLDTKVDTIGYARYKNIYVYDMANSKITAICKHNYLLNGNTIKSLCTNSREIPLNIFNKTIDKIESLSNRLILYPYPNQKNVAISLEDEKPRFRYKKGYGLPISVIFNNHFYKNVKLKKFILQSGNRVVPSTIVTFRNDISKKIKKGTYVLVPLNRLKRKTKYFVNLRATASGKPIEYSWSFTTR